MDTIDDGDVLELGQDGAFDLSEAENVVKNLDTPPSPPNLNKLKLGQGTQSPNGRSGSGGRAEVAAWENNKTQGNEAFSKNDIDGARVFYTKALADNKVVGVDRAKVRHYYGFQIGGYFDIREINQLAFRSPVSDSIQ